MFIQLSHSELILNKIEYSKFLGIKYLKCFWPYSCVMFSRYLGGKQDSKIVHKTVHKNSKIVLTL